MCRPTTSPCSRMTSGSKCTSSRRSEEHTSELQSRLHLVCRLLLEKERINDFRLLISDYKGDRFSNQQSKICNLKRHPQCLLHEASGIFLSASAHVQSIYLRVMNAD